MTTAILVDPFTHLVTEFETSGASFKPMLGDHVTTFDHVTLMQPTAYAPGAVLYLDDTGMTVPDQAFWSFVNHPDRIFAGRGVIICIDEQGEDCDGVAEPEKIAEHVVWRDVRFVGMEEITEDDVEIAPGMRGFRLTRRAKFEEIL